jgi:hypothetical protein
MSKKSSSQFKSYFGASFIMAIGLAYNVIEQDFIGSTVFLISSIVFLSLGLIKKRKSQKET